MSPSAIRSIDKMVRRQNNFENFVTAKFRDGYIKKKIFFLINRQWEVLCKQYYSSVVIVYCYLQLNLNPTIYNINSSIVMDIKLNSFKKSLSYKCNILKFFFFFCDLI